MSGLCARCHFNSPMPNDDFCLDCSTEVELMLEALTSGAAGTPIPSAVAERSVVTRVTAPEDQPGPFYFCCTPCECGGQCEKCR